MAVTVQREVRKRGFFGKLVKLAFIVFNVLMAIWLVSYWGSAARIIDTAGSDAGRAGGAIGVTIGTGFLMFFWLAGAVILGIIVMLTRGQRVLITEERP
jgi:NADH:ubiquinone oxidoreductase subunit 6 (subunit J)